MSRKQTADDTHVGKRCKKKAATPTTMMTMTTVAIAPTMTPKVRRPCKNNAATPPPWFVASLAETDITAASAEDIVSLLAGGLHDPSPSGRVKESVQRGRHIVQLFHGTAIVQVVRETTGPETDKIMTILHELHKRGAAKQYLVEVKKSLSFLAAKV